MKVSGILLITGLSFVALSCGDTNRENAMTQEELRAISNEVVNPEQKLEVSTKPGEADSANVDSALIED